MTSDSSGDRRSQLPKPAFAVQVLAIIGFTGFAIPVSLSAMDQYGILGLLLAAFFGYQWTRLAGIGTSDPLSLAVDLLKPQVSDSASSSGNASFDAHRDELLGRLALEQANFEGFLSRLRDAKDRSEFDRYLVERERVISDNRAALGT